ncbi:GNAT family N-acetyltransferase [Photobacterium sp. GJ3]|uniref:GNAT family N-acetyltransferase n=1 Tax=Photobacterium sp. GJ3 TaxID=2829502 RepID=UPI001B8C9620|nr:GNAT family N-acetyltransferase [Photobacterium sp. GJ3]QUJ66501.1 GNAT family N-acetyltransferase [Photobacterium sp. GJ3]
MNPTFSKETVNAAYAAYFRFNNARTLSTATPSQLNIIQDDDLTAFIDPTRRYDNQILITHADAVLGLDAFLSHYHESTPPEIHVAPSAVHEALLRTLIEKGYVPAYAHEFLVLAAEAYQPGSQASAVRVEMWGNDQADEFLALLKTSGLTCDDDIWQAKRHLYCSETFRCYVAYVDETPCAWATTFFDGKTAILANAYTQAAFRKQGCQTALLHQRIQDAVAQGANRLLTDVMSDSASSKNCKAVGFSTHTIRTVWEKALS